jgi:integrase
MKKTITQRKDGRFCTTVQVSSIDGIKKRVYICKRTQHEVELEMIRLQYESQNSIYIARSAATLTAYLREWLPAYNKGRIVETTYATYQMYLDKHILPALGKLKLQELLPIHVQRFYGSLLRTLSGKSVRKIHFLLNRAFRDAVRNQLLRANPCDAVVPPRHEILPPGRKAFRPRLCADADVLRLMDAVSGTIDEVCILLASVGGLCRGEVLGLTWGDVDFTGSRISVQQTYTRFDKDIFKGPKRESRRRTIKLPEVVFETLRRFFPVNAQPSDRVVPQYKPQSYSQHWRLLADRLGLQGLRFHDLRHYNATLMLRKGIPDKVAAARLGHSSVSTTREIYQHVYQDMDDSAASIIADHVPVRQH